MVYDSATKLLANHSAIAIKLGVMYTNKTLQVHGGLRVHNQEPSFYKAFVEEIVTLVKNEVRLISKIDVKKKEEAGAQPPQQITPVNP